MAVTAVHRPARVLKHLHVVKVQEDYNNLHVLHTRPVQLSSTVSHCAARTTPVLCSVYQSVRKDAHSRNLYVCLNPTYASTTAAGTVSFEVVLSACGAVQISYPGNFTVPSSGKYTVGFSAQYNNMSDSVCESSAASQQCEKWYSISSGAALLVNPVTAPCVTLDATAAGATAAAAAAVEYLALDAFTSGVGTAFTCMVANPEYLGDGFCDDDAYNTAACGYDGVHNAGSAICDHSVPDIVHAQAQVAVA
eukprot:15970-Heterococcus_DN1.PRE.1